MGDGVAVAVAWLWLGLVVAISGIEAPLKFRAPGVTLAIGLSIGRLIFRALNAVELALVSVLIVGTATGGLVSARTRAILVTVAALLGAVLLAQVFALRPVLDRRARAVIAGRDVPPSRLHRVYIAAEAVKAAALLLLGVLLLVRLTVP